MPLKVGDKAPDFTLFNSDKKPVSLSDYKGKNVLILFYPFAFSSTCTTEFCGIRDKVFNFDGLNTEILAISIDTPYTLAKWKEIEKFNFELLSDFNKIVSMEYDSLYDVYGKMKMHGVSKRSAFVVDADGIVQYTEVLEDANAIPDMDTIKARLKELELA